MSSLSEDSRQVDSASKSALEGRRQSRGCNSGKREPASLVEWGFPNRCCSAASALGSEGLLGSGKLRPYRVFGFRSPP